MTDTTFLAQVEESIKAQLEDVATLTTAANKHPYYKYVSTPHAGNGSCLPITLQVQLQVDQVGARCHPHRASGRLAGW